MFKWKVGLLSYNGKSILTRNPKKENCHIQDLPRTVQVTPWGLPFPSRAACPLKCDNGYVPTGAAVCGAGRWHKACCCAGCWLSQTVRDFGKRSTGFKRFFSRQNRAGRLSWSTSLTKSSPEGLYLAISFLPISSDWTNSTTWAGWWCQDLLNWVPWNFHS